MELCKFWLEFCGKSFPQGAVKGGQNGIAARSLEVIVWGAEVVEVEQKDAGEAA